MISIIVPVFHVEKELRRCLDSILGQTYTDFELILVNDGGNKAESLICEEYAKKDSRIVYRYQSNQGLSSARNTGLDIARGEWIMFVDSDDWVSEDFCKKAYEAVAGTGARMAIFDLVYTEGDSREGHIHASMIDTGIYPSDEILKIRLTGDIAGYAWNKIYHRSLWDNIRFPVGEIWEDDAIMHELMDKADKIAIIHDVLYYKPYRRESITSQAMINKEWDKWVFIQRRKRYDYIKEHHPEMLDIEKNILATSALQYAKILSQSPKGRHEMNEIRNMLKNEKIMLKGASLKREMAFKLWYYFPGVFIAVIRAVRH